MAGGVEVLDDETEAAVTRVYLAVLQQPRASRALLVAQGIPGDTVDRAMRVLAARGLVTLTEAGWEVQPPDIALPALAADLERRARTNRAAAQELAQVFFQARAGARQPSEGLRQLESLEELRTTTAEIVASATSLVRAMRNRSPRTEVMIRAATRAHREPPRAVDGSRLTLRSVFESAVLEVEGAGELLLARAAVGEKMRFVDQLPFSVVVADEAAAVVDLSTYEQTGRGSLLVRSRPLVLALGALVDTVWLLGTPWAPGRQSVLERRDLQILSLLAAGSSDAAIARQSGISQRTVERRVRALMDRLGASTRFQAGVQATRRGWL